MDTVPFILLGDKHRATLRLQLAQCVTAWWSGWATTGAPDIYIRDDGGRPPRIPPGVQSVVARSAAGAPLLAVRASHEFMTALSGSAPAASNSSGELAGALGTEVLKSLCIAVLNRVQVVDARVDVPDAAERMPADLHLPRCVIAEMNLGATRAVLTLTLTSLLLQRFGLRTATQPVENVVSRRTAIRQEATRVEAVLGSVDVTLLDVAKLAPGDVIVLDQSLGQAGHLTTPAGAHIAKIVLGRSGAQRAVSLARQVAAATLERK